jgi:hypothetical protein
MRKKRIPLNIDKPGTPIAVLHSILSSLIFSSCRDWQIAVPEELQPWIDKHHPEVGYEWEIELLQKAPNMPLELLERWVKAMPGGFCRAEMRGVLRNRESNKKEG